MSQTLANISITEEDDEIVPKKVKSLNKRGPSKTYILDSVYNTFEEAEEVLKLEKIWSHTKPHKTKAGKKYFYRCNIVTSRNAIQCDAAVHILLHANDTKCSIHRTYCKN